MINRRDALTLLSAGVVSAGSLGLLLAPRPARAALQLKTHDPETGSILSQALAHDGFWQGAKINTYDNKLYDEVRLKELDQGYLARVTGEGQRDFDYDVVVRTVFENMQRLPQVEDGAKAVVKLGHGTDAKTGLPYADSFYYLDFSLFYGVYAQRMYKVVDGDKTILYFEKLTPQIAGAKWTEYQRRMDQIVEGVKRRALFNAVQDVSQIFGMFVVQPGTTFKTRVSFTTKVHFGEGSGMIARMGSEMPSVIKAGLRSGFDSCVAIATLLQDGG